MIRWILYCAIFVAVLLVPLERADVAKLQPVQTVCIYYNESDYIIETDTGALGKGTSIEEALVDLIETTPAVVYLDTADFLLLLPGTESAVEHLRGVLKDSVELYYYEGDPDLKIVSKYLEIHRGNQVLKTWKNGVKIPVLKCQDSLIKLS